MDTADTPVHEDSWQFPRVSKGSCILFLRMLQNLPVVSDD